MQNLKKLYFLLMIIFFLCIPVFSQEGVGELKPLNMSVSFNGKFIFQSQSQDSKANSNNGVFWCQYEICHVSDETRELLNFKFYKNDKLLYSMKQAPGSDVYISNLGIVAFMDMTYHFKHELIIHFYSKYGQQLFSETINGASLFGFSETGSIFGVGTGKGFFVISIPEHKIATYESADQFDISEDERLIAVARGGKVKVYSNGKLLNEFDTDFIYPRKIKISSQYNLLAVIDKKQLKVYSLKNGKILFSDKLSGKKSYRDIILNNGKILTGIHYRSNGISKGILKIIDIKGNTFLEKEESNKKFKTFQKQNKLKKSNLNYDEIPWPFVPFDSMHTVWNYYEQHMSYGQPDWSYLHQGLDIITPIGEPTYAVAEGIVKCVLTLGSSKYWRTAISKEQSAGYSKGWLYAHLIESTIQFDVGDTVQIHDYLGNIIHWYDDWGHIHFVEIEDSGLVWRYDDNEWGITYNPLLSLQPDTDLVPPIIENVFEDSKFAFCLNETSVYLEPDSLYGSVDIIAKITDYVADSPWEQPTYETYYWVKKSPDGEIVFPKTLGQRLNHSYNFYASGHYEPYATTIYKRDERLLPPRWMDMQRDYYHILTNNNGDSLIDLSEKNLAFATTDYPDGDYRIFIKAKDAYGNSTVDSMDVKIRNGLNDVPLIEKQSPTDFALQQNYPNPFNPATKICYSLPSSDFVKLTIYDVLGKQVEMLVNEFQQKGRHSIIFKANNLACGIYFYKLEAGKFGETKKMLLLL